MKVYKVVNSCVRMKIDVDSIVKILGNNKAFSRAITTVFFQKNQSQSNSSQALLSLTKNIICL
ncbi:hypothetical protein fh0823_21010 [Francisella halioticida]|nr:hypothetical protein fh0823_21010 [Francisella halioticida]